jgi:hypothetical protein
MKEILKIAEQFKKEERFVNRKYYNVKLENDEILIKSCLFELKSTSLKYLLYTELTTLFTYMLTQ